MTSHRILIAAALFPLLLAPSTPASPQDETAAAVSRLRGKYNSGVSNMKPEELDAHREALLEPVVASGTVRFSARRDPTQSLILKAGDAARLARENIAPIALALDSVNTQNALSWRAGGFKFSDHTVGAVINELERRFDVRIKVTSKSLLNMDHGVLKDNPLGAEEIIRDICELNHCQYRTVPGGYEITQAAAE